MSSPEELFKNAFERYETEPPEEAWQKISSELAWKSFFRFYPKRVNIYYLSAVLLIAGLAGSFALSDTDEPITIQSAESGSKNITVSQRKVLIINAPSRHEYDHKVLIQPQNPVVQDGDASAADFFADNSQPIAKRQQPDSETSENVFPETSYAEVDFSAEFVSDIVEGCAPCTVHFANRSINADYCVWNFGNGKTSYDFNARATYTASGTYYVTLKTVNGTRSRVYAQTVKVNPSPSATIVHTKATTSAPMITEARNADNVSHLKWNFGDEATSTSSKAAHKYKNTGVYALELIVSNQYCADTIRENIEVSAPEYSISFPNALYASADGAGDGYSNNTKFHAFMPNGDVNQIERYSLRVYTKQGKEVFTSTNPAFGWNGYYNGRRLSAGVYVYKATAVFTNGEVINTNGNITLMYGE